MSRDEEDAFGFEIPDDDLDAGLAGAWDAMEGLPPLSGFQIADHDVSVLDIDEVLPDDGAPQDLSDDPELAQAAALVEGSGRYRVHHELGRGGMGLVLGARDRRIGRFVAIKLLHEVPRQYRHRLRRFVEEAQIAGQLQHPSIVPVYDVGILDGARPYFTMKYVKGRTLADALRSRRDT
ncbi:MAG: protein kinase, partial [Planctomycetes bacterium]|nr:protein kinase [Planctomycetota bacterium]